MRGQLHQHARVPQGPSATVGLEPPSGTPGISGGISGAQQVKVKALRSKPSVGREGGAATVPPVAGPSRLSGEGVCLALLHQEEASEPGGPWLRGCCSGVCNDQSSFSAQTTGSLLLPL